MLLYCVATFGRECTSPMSKEPWTDLKTLLHDCVEENVVLVVDDRYRTVEMLAALVEEHRNQITPEMFQWLEVLIVGIVNTPHSRVEVKVGSGGGPDVECGGRQVSEAILRACPFPIDFEYAVPSAWACRAIAGCLVNAAGDATGSLHQLGEELVNATEVECRSEVQTPGECRSAATPTAASCCFVEKRLADVVGEAAVQQNDMAASGRDELTRGDGRAVEQVKCSPSSDEVRRAEELIWLGRYQESKAHAKKSFLKRTHSFGAFKTFADLSEVLGRALRCSEKLEILDAIFGTKILDQVNTAVDLAGQSKDVQRFAVSIYMFLELWKDCRIVEPTRPAVVRTYVYGRDEHTEEQVRHCEQMFKCLGHEVVVHVIRDCKPGGRAHNRYVYSTMAIVRIPDGCDVVLTDHARAIAQKKINLRRGPLRMAPEKAFDFAERSPHIVEEMKRYRVEGDASVGQATK
jgi:hypothetical protein